MAVSYVKLQCKAGVITASYTVEPDTVVIEFPQPLDGENLFLSIDGARTLRDVLTTLLGKSE